jgi:peptide/nickel transport system permease protein/oligopeptide transport system permease protein
MGEKSETAGEVSAPARKPTDRLAAAAGVEVTLSPNQRAWRRFRRNRVAMGSLVFLVWLGLFVVFWPFLSPFEADAVSDAQFQTPGETHWLGTDVHGRDLLTRLAVGGRISLLVGLVGAAVSLVIGVSWGAVAGYRGGRWDALMMRLVDILYAMPTIVFVIVLVTTLEELLKSWLASVAGSAWAGYSRLLFLFVGLGAVSWLTMARIVRGQVLSLKDRAFVEASRALGASHGRLLWHHILPNTWGTIIAYLTLTIPGIILYESFLSYLGLGIQPPMASWGSLIADGAGQLNPIRVYWWLLVFPSGSLVATLLALNFVGDGLRDALNPRRDATG